jgi:ATP-dependent RNA helicase RhlE
MKHVANRVVKHLADAGIQGAAIHGNKSQSARTKALDGFRSGAFRVLVATDVAARGLDVDDISHVINYDMPIEAETYVHRIGRTARAGADGDAISFCCAEEKDYLRSIDRLLGDPVPSETDHAYHCETVRRSCRPAAPAPAPAPRAGKPEFERPRPARPRRGNRRSQASS